MDNQDDNSHVHISPAEVFKQDKNDAVHSGVKLGLSILPLASEVFDLLITSVLDKQLQILTR